MPLPSCRIFALPPLVAFVGCAECCSDLDCATRVDAEGPLCIDGACIAGDPADVAVADCDVDDDCGEDELCFEGSCAAAPSCLRLDRTFVAVDDADNRGEVVATSDGCEVFFDVTVAGTIVRLSVGSIARDGAWVAPVGFDGGGGWDVTRRVGVLEGVAGRTIRFGTENYACLSDGDCLGQVRERCAIACDADPRVCDDDPCIDGFCGAPDGTAGVCR